MSAEEAILPFERWADISARLLRRGPAERLDILEELEIDPVDWSKNELHWAMTLSRDADADRQDRMELYAAKCLAEMNRRREPKVQESAEAPAAPSPPIASTAACQEPLAAPPAAFVQPPAAPVSPPEPPAVVLPKPASALGTTMPAVMLPPGKPLPFGEQPSREFVDALQVPRAAAAAEQIGDTQPLPIVEDAGQGALGARPLDAPVDLAMTGPIKLPATAEPPLPFSDRPAPEFVEAMQTPRAPAPRTAITDATLPLQMDLMAQARAAMPFLKPSAPVEAPRLSLDAYASLCAELAVRPESRAKVFRRYGIRDDAAWRAVDQEWRVRFTERPEIQREWQGKYDRFREWLLRKA
ncbi:hypothetical protein [Polyangium mundeleinium]|uniref:Uncharacterized protein n=1 Tax=Polyangium mundeleinium TaxID=2995306 RepID=A0ABT5EGJ9_9BACT|nr:hypothetical protein [Polyangium mundeleinium]MDC0740948.1 hypothetical protein [Polyangium mundeleinium]